MKLPTKSALVAILGDLTFVLTLLASAPYELGEVATLFSPDLKGKLTAIGAFATVALKVTQRAMERLQGNQDRTAITVTAQAVGVLPAAPPPSPEGAPRVKAPL